MTKEMKDEVRVTKGILKSVFNNRTILIKIFVNEIFYFNIIDIEMILMGV